MPLIVSAGAAAETDFFAGRWKVDPLRSAVIVRCCTPDDDGVASQLAEEELLTIEGAGHDVRAVDDILNADGSHRISQYRATYNNGQWYPFEGSSAGHTGGTIMVARADDRTELCIRRDAKGRFVGLFLRQVAEDDVHMAVASFNALGKLTESAILDKQ